MLKRIVSIFIVLVICLGVFNTACIVSANTEKDADDTPESFFYKAAEKLASAISNIETEADLTVYNIPAEQFDLLWNYTHDSYPDLFYFPSNAQALSDGGAVGMVKWEYAFKKDEIITLREKYILALKSAATIFDGAKTEFDKALLAHDYLASHVSYGKDNILSHTAYGALVDGVSVCQGYAMGYTALLKYTGVKCIYVFNQTHAWNIVYLGEIPYHVDVTSDDPLIRSKSGFRNIKHTYFLRDDSFMSNDYPDGWKTNLPSKTPVCYDNTYDNAFFRNAKGKTVLLDNVWYYASERCIYAHYANIDSLLTLESKLVFEAKESIHTIDSAYGRLYYITYHTIGSVSVKGHHAYLLFDSVDIALSYYTDMWIIKNTLFYEAYDINGNLIVRSFPLINSKFKTLLPYKQEDGRLFITPNTKRESIVGEYDDSIIKLSDNSTNLGTGAVLEIYDRNGYRTDSVTVIMIGDVDGDEKIDTTDYLRIKRFFTDSSFLLYGDFLAAADVDSDGSITTTDYLRIKRYFQKTYTF